MILLFIIFVFYFYVSKGVVKNYSNYDDALRIRIIPNSNSAFDQNLKGKVKNKLNITMYDLLKDAESTEEARRIISNSLNLVSRDVKKIMSDENVSYGYNVNYGYNYFPEKEYKGVKYSEGYYESLLVTLGEGKGDNWWCVLFPPLCLIEADDSEEVEYKSLIDEILKKYIH